MVYFDCRIDVGSKFDVDVFEFQESDKIVGDFTGNSDREMF